MSQVSSLADVITPYWHKIDSYLGNGPDKLPKKKKRQGAMAHGEQMMGQWPTKKTVDDR